MMPSDPFAFLPAPQPRPVAPALIEQGPNDWQVRTRNDLPLSASFGTVARAWSKPCTVTDSDGSVREDDILFSQPYWHLQLATPTNDFQYRSWPVQELQTNPELLLNASPLSRPNGPDIPIDDDVLAALLLLIAGVPAVAGPIEKTVPQPRRRFTNEEQKLVRDAYTTASTPTEKLALLDELGYDTDALKNDYNRAHRQGLTAKPNAKPKSKTRSRPP